MYKLNSENLAYLLGIPGLRIKGIDLPDSDTWPRVRSYKGVEYKFSNVRTEAKGLRDSIYWDWYNTARLSKIFCFAQSRGVLPKEKLLKNAIKKVLKEIKIIEKGIKKDE